MAETLTVQITAQDGATRVFKAVEGSAASMGKAVEAAGKSGTTGIRSLTQELQRLDSEISTVGTAMVGLGAAITGALALPLAKGTKAAWDQVSAVEQATFALGAYGDSAEDVNAALQDLTRYAQDASRSGGIFWSQDLFYAAQTLRTLGAELDNVSEYVQIMSRSVGIGAGSWDRLLEVIGRVGATSQLTALDIDELAKMGFQLDRSLAGMTVTWDELFAILDRGIPAEALLGQADTIQGAFLYLEGALVNLGQAFLGVDENFQFIAGGLGDQMVQGIRSVTESINDLRPAATAFGSGVGTVVTGVFKLVEAFNALPEPAQQAIAMTTGIGGASLVAAGSIALMVSPVMRLSSAMLALGRSAAAARLLTLAINPLTLGITAAVAAGVGLHKIFQNARESATSLTRGIEGLTVEIERLKLAGEVDTAAGVQGILDSINAQIELLSGSDLPAIVERLGLPEGTTLLDLGQLQSELQQAEGMTDEFAEHITNTLEQISDPAAQQAYLAWINDLLSQIEHTVEGSNLDDIMREVLTTPASEVPGVMEAVTGSTNTATDSVTGLAAAFGLLQDEGKGLLDTILNLNTVTDDDSFADRLLKTLGLDASQRGQIDSITEQVRGLRVELEDMPEPGATQDEWMDWVNQEGISQQERTRRINAANEARREEEAGLARTALLNEMNASAIDGVTEALASEQAQTDATIEAATLLNEAYEARNELIEENIARLQEAAGVDDPLSQWNLGEYATDMSRLADATLDAATALDTVFRVVVSNTDAIGNQVSAVEDWALELINVRGEYGLIDDLLAAGTITLQEYNAAQEAQETISAANLAIQEDILTIQARQAPLIADHTAALADQMDVISGYPAQQQLIALGWMDATTAGRAMEFQTLAVAAAAGELGANGEEAFTSMITGAAQADPVLKALLIDMGLISEGADGTITVNLDGAEQAQSDLELLATTVADLIDLLDDGIMNASYQLKVDMETSVNGEPTGTEGIAGVLQGLLDNVTGQDAEVDLEVKPQLPPNAGELLQQSFGGQAVEIEVAPVIRAGMDWLGGGIGALLGGDSGPQDTTVTIDAVDNATPVIDGITAQLTALGAWDATIDISAPNAYTTIGDLNGVQSAAEAVPGSVTTWTLAAGYVEAIGALNGVQAAAEAIPNSVTTVISAVDNASAVIGDAVSFLASVDGYTSTMTLNVVTNQITRTSSQRHGGIPGFANGGVLFEGGEAGLEVAHFANGGIAILPHHALYSAPTNTYISPANANEGLAAPAPTPSIELHIHGNVYGIDDLAGALETAIVQRRAGFGGV